MIDFKEIETSEDWESFARDFLVELGYVIESAPDRGPDGGKDLIIRESLTGKLGKYRMRWLVSCKHYARGGKSIGVSDETNILDRVRKWDCEGFLGFYSTTSSAELNNTLRRLKEKYEIKDYEIFYGKYIESHLIKTGFSEILMRYLPESYKKIKPLHLVLNEYLPLNCDNCERDLLGLLYQKQYNAVLVYVIKIEPEREERIIKDIYWACKGDCDRALQNQHDIPNVSMTLWDDVSDLVIPAWFLRFIVGTLNGLRSGSYIYSDEAFEKIKHFTAALSQRVFREMTFEEQERVSRLFSLPDGL